LGRNDVLILVTVLAAAASCVPVTGRDIPEFDGARAFTYLEEQVSFGPRVPGTEAHARTRDWIVRRLRERTGHVMVQTFRGKYAGSEREMYNIVASFGPEKKNRVLLCAHWDSRPFADRDPLPENRTKPVPGANDGASGVAVLLEIAEAVSNVPPDIGVDMAFFDGEDGGAYGDDATWLLGSRHFARAMPSSFRPRYAVLLDMIGDRELSLSRDVNSMLSAPVLWERITSLCGKYSIGFLPGEADIVDDHIPLIERGIPSVDLIDFDYPSWHTVSDTPDKCSPESLEKVGKLVLSLLYGE